MSEEGCELWFYKRTNNKGLGVKEEVTGRTPVQADGSILLQEVAKFHRDLLPKPDEAVCRSLSLQLRPETTKEAGA